MHIIKLCPLNGISLSLFKKGLSDYKKAQYQSAILYFESVLINERCAIAAYYYRGKAYAHLGQYKIAFDNYIKAMRIQKHQSLWNACANIQYKLKNYQGALEYYNRAIAMNPKECSYYINKGDTLRKLGNYNQALEAYKHALALKRDCAETYQSRGSLYLETKAYELAICDYHTALKLNPNLNGAQQNLAKAKVQLRRLDKPKNPHIQDEISLLLQKYRHENTLIKQRYLGLTPKEPG